MSILVKVGLIIWATQNIVLEDRMVRTPEPAHHNAIHLVGYTASLEGYGTLLQENGDGSERKSGLRWAKLPLLKSETIRNCLIN